MRSRLLCYIVDAVRSSSTTLAKIGLDVKLYAP
jgi:hypothetical protein